MWMDERQDGDEHEDGIKRYERSDENENEDGMRMDEK